MTYTVIITEETAANITVQNSTSNITVTDQTFPITIEYNATNIVANATYGNADVAAYLASGTLNSNVTTSGNVTGNYFVGNGSLLTGIAASYGNANVAAYLASGTNSSNISTTGTVQGAYVTGNGSALTALTGANVTGTVANATYAASAGSATTAVSANTANIATVAYSVAAGNVTGTVANATYALNANAATYATVATSANTANTVAGSNVTGTVPLAQYVTQAAQANITSLGTLSQLSVSGNTITGNLAVNTDAVIGGNLTVNGTTTTVNSNTVVINDKFINLANNAASAAQANGGGIGLGPVGTEYATWTWDSGSNTWTTAQNISTTGNVQGAYLLGNGSQITGLPAGYSNADVATYLASGTNSSNIVTTANISGTYLLGNGAFITGIATSTYGNANVAAFLAAFGSNSISTTGNVTANQAFVSQIESAATLDINAATGININDSDISVGDNNTTVTVATKGTGDLVLRTNRGAANQGNIVIEDGATGNIQLNPQAQVSVSRDITVSGNITATATVSTTGTVTGSYVYSSGAVSGAGNVQGGNLRTAGVVTATGNIDGGNLRTAGVVTATGNVTGANLVASSNVTSTQQTVIGTATTGTTGNIVLSGKNIATDVAANAETGTAAGSANARVVIGTGWAGNVTFAAAGSRLSAQDLVSRGNTALIWRETQSDLFTSITANVSQNAFRQHALGAYHRIGGGPAANTVSSASVTGGVPFLVAATNHLLDVGNVAPFNLGNTRLSHAALDGGIMQLYGNSFVSNAFGSYNFITNGGSTTGNVFGNVIGFSTSLGLPAIPTGNVYAFYHPGTTNLYGPSTSTSAQQAPQYYAFYNEDNVAQMRLGSVRALHYYQANLATSGTVNIDKNNGQVQYLAPTGNVTIGDFQNFVTTATAGSTNVPQMDTVTIVIKQGATPYNVTLPTGNAQFAFRNGITTVPAVANTATYVTVTSHNGAGSPYFVDIRSSSTTNQLPAAGSTNNIQINNAGALASSPNLTFDLASNLMVIGGTANVGGSLNVGAGASITGALSVSGNVTGNYFVGNGSALTGITASLSGTMTGNIAGNSYQITNLGHVSLGNSSNIAIGTGTITNNQLSPPGLVTNCQFDVGAGVSATGNVVGANVITNNYMTFGAFSAATLANVTGTGGQVVSVSSNGHRLAFWDTTNTRWSYVHDNSAV